MTTPDSNSSNPLERLLDELKPAGRLKTVSFALPQSQRCYQIVLPDDLDLLLDAAVDDPEENLPHWAEPWPSGIALADAVITQPQLVQGQRVLELGCGLGVTAIAALESGAVLTAADYSRPSLLLCRYNTLHNAGIEPEAIQVNWRSPSDEFKAVVGAGFPVVLAADILYESRDLQPLLDIIERLVAPGGLLWLAEPGRDVAQRFLEIMRGSDWDETVSVSDGPWPDPQDEGVRVTIVQFRRPI